MQLFETELLLDSQLHSDPWASSQFDAKLGKREKLDDDSFDDGASTCAPPSVACSSVDSLLSTPDMAPFESPFADADLFLLLDIKDARVCIVHHDEMQGHVPPRVAEVYELPRRVIAIENSLKGLETCCGIQKRTWGNEPMQFMRPPRGKNKDLVVAYGSRAPKRRRLTYSTGPATAGSVWAACNIVEAPIAQECDLRLVHDKKHIDKVTELCNMAKETDSAFYPLERPFSKFAQTPKSTIGLLNDDVFYSPGSLAAMKRAVGGAVEAVRQLFQIDPSTGQAAGRSDTESSFAIVRPPGHHCCTDPNGFCYFNNSAIAVSHARQVLGLKRVAIVDWDYHHGDGQQTVFYEDPTVLTISMHVAVEVNKFGVKTQAFPGNRGMDIAQNGAGKGKGYNINIPWPHDQVGDLEYQEAFRSIVMPALRGFDPELIVVACGFDALKGDKLAGTGLLARTYYDMSKQLTTLKKPVSVILEGGYSPELLGQGALNVTHALLGRGPPSTDSSPQSAEVPTAYERGHINHFEAIGVIDAVRCRLNTLLPWSDLCQPGSDTFFHEDSSAEAPAGLEVASRLSQLIKEQAWKD